MSNRAEKAAQKIFRPINKAVVNLVSKLELINFQNLRMEQKRQYIAGYEQAEKDTIERAIKWLKENWREYVWTTDNGIPHFGHWENDFRKAMEE